MKTLKLRDDFYWAGIVDDTLRVFDIIMYTEFGTILMCSKAAGRSYYLKR